MNAADLGAKVTNLTSDLVVLDADRGRIALQAEQGSTEAERSLSDLTVERATLVAAIDQANLAYSEALRREEAEARTEAQRREAEEERRIQALKQAAHDRFAEADVLLVALRDKLEEARLAFDEVRVLGDAVVNGMFYSEVVSRSMTLLAGSGFAFKKLPFHMVDEKGRPRADEQALAPRLPFSCAPADRSAA